MGSRSHRRLGRQTRGAAARRRAMLPRLALSLAALGTLTVAPGALAQSQPDAGAARQAATPAPLLKSIPNPALLSESVRARLQERAAARHPSQIAASTPPEPSPSAASVAAQGARQHAAREALERNGAQPRRVQALDTGDGVTVLSNRVSEAPTPRLASLARTAPKAPEPGMAEPEEEASEDESSVTETRSLRALSSRREVPKARERSLGIDWLIWPFVLLSAIGAVVGTLWFSKKTE